METSVKASFSFPVENTPNNRSVCQNTVVFHFSQWLPKPFISCCFLAHILTHLDPETLPESEYEGRFFPEGSPKKSIRFSDRTTINQITMIVF
jgi:hypothetical protein